MIEKLNIDYSNVYNIGNKNTFLKQTYSHQKEETIIAIARAFNKIGIIENQLEKDLYDFSLQDLILLFERLKWVSINTFAQKKNMIYEYFLWAFDNGKIEQDNIKNIANIAPNDLRGSLAFEQDYFKDFSMLDEFIDVIINIHDPIDPRQFYNERCMLYCAWIGITQDELITILIRDVDLNCNKIFIESTNRTISNIDQKIMSYFRKLTYMTNYIADRNGHELTVNMNNTPYLFRKSTNRISDSAINKQSIRYDLWAFQRVLDDIDVSNQFYGKQLSYDKVYWSGIFHKLYEYEQSNKTEITKELFIEISQIDCTTMVAARRIKNYHQWRKHFYGI